MEWYDYSQYARHRGQNVRRGVSLPAQLQSRMSYGAGYAVHAARGTYGNGFCDGLCDGLGSFLKLGAMLTAVAKGLK